MDFGREFTPTHVIVHSKSNDTGKGLCSA